MKRFLFLMAALAAVAVTAAPSQAAFTLTFNYISGGPNPPGAIPAGNTQTVFSSSGAGGGIFSSGSNVIDLYDGDPGTGTFLRLSYDIVDNTAAGRLEVTNLDLSYGTTTAGIVLPAISVSLTATEDQTTVPAGTGPVQFSSNLSIGGTPGNTFSSSATASQVGGGSATVTSPGTVPVFPPLNPGPPPAGTNQTTTFTRGTGAGTLSATVVFNFPQQASTTVGAVLQLSPTTPNVVPVPATALMGVVALPLFGVLRRFRRTTAAA